MRGSIAWRHFADNICDTWTCRAGGIAVTVRHDREGNWYAVCGSVYFALQSKEWPDAGIEAADLAREHFMYLASAAADIKAAATNERTVA